jgi:sulfonate transport system permease protein
MKNARILWALLSLAVGASLIGLWQLIADARLISPVFLPSPSRALGAMVGGFESGVLWAKIAGTIVRMIYGWLLASLVGIAIGALIGSSTRARRLLEPTLEFLRPLPASAVIPLAIGLFGLTETMVLAVICFGALWPALLATVHGFAAVEPRLYEVARALGISFARSPCRARFPTFCRACELASRSRLFSPSSARCCRAVTVSAAGSC